MTTNDRTPPTPDTTQAEGDPGDETARRYRYQWTWAAITCCMLLDDSEQVVEVFCEHHEDVLIKYADGMFTGLQIKTRQSDQALWKTSDAAVVSSCARFAMLEARFPGQFRTFRFLTNHPLYAAESAQSLPFVLHLIRTATVASALPDAARRFLARVSKEAGCTPDEAFAALSKTDAIDGLPTLRDVEMRLATTLTEVWATAADCSHTSILRAARNLVSECERASSLAHQDVLPAYLPATVDPVGAELSARLAGKRMDHSRVVEILTGGLAGTAPLHGDPDTLVQPGGGSTHLLLKKLDAGGFSAVSRNSAEDLRNKADYLGIVWTQRHGRSAGLQRYSHVRSLVLTDAGRAFETAKTSDRRFGLQMLSDLRSRFQQRRVLASDLYECSDEHLEGFAYSLTSECKIQWSVDRPWEAE